MLPSRWRWLAWGAVAAAALALLAAGCSSDSTANSASSPSRPAAASSPAASSPAPSGPATRIVAYPVRVSTYRLVDKTDKPVAVTTKDLQFPQSFSFAASARDGYYLPGQARHQIVYLIAGPLAFGASPSAAIQDYLGEFQSQEVHLTPEPAGPLGGEVVCWEAGGFTFCMWADGGPGRGTFGILDYRPPLGPDTVLIHHLAGLVPLFRRAMERAAH
jgi:hypothetical protein